MQPTRDPVFSSVRYANAMQPPKCSSEGLSSAIPGFSREPKVIAIEDIGMRLCQSSKSRSSRDAGGGFRKADQRVWE